MSVEERVRSATRERAGLVRDISPLDLPAASPARQGRPARLPRPLRARGWGGWLAPVTAAAVVVALAITTVAVREAHTGPMASATASATAGGGAISTAGGLPAYYAALDNPEGPAFQDKEITTAVDVIVGDTGTGQRIASLAPPRGQTFAGLTAAADDRTFALAAESLPVEAGIPTGAPTAWYLLRLTPGAVRAATLTKLAIPAQPVGTQVSGIALSPDGSELAVMYQRDVWDVLNKQGHLVKTGPLMLSLYSVATGRTLRTWTEQTNSFPAGYGWYWGRYSNTTLTWLDGGRTLAFTDGINDGENGPPLAPIFGGVKIRTISVASASGSLLGDSTVIFSEQNHWCDQLQLTANGRTVFCGGYYGDDSIRSSESDPEITEYSVATGAGHVVYRLKGTYNTGVANIAWASADGSKLVVAALALDDQIIKGRLTHVRVAAQAIGELSDGDGDGVLAPIRLPLSGVPLAAQIAF